MSKTERRIPQRFFLPMQVEPGQLIDDRYKITGHLGQGGMGVVWKAEDLRVGDEVVIKMPLASVEPEILRRFGEEARVMRKFSRDSVSILGIQDVGDVDGVPYYVMRYLPGGSLRNWQLPTNEDGGPNYSRKSLDWLIGIAGALDFLHSENVLHRDVKPENILFNRRGHAYLVDFGIVKSVTEATRMTQSEHSPGTLAYMPPEVLMGVDEATGKVDQYALAVTLYEVLAGQRPYSGPTSVAVYAAIDNGHTPLVKLIPGFPVAASAAVDRALAKDTNRRFESCAKFAEAFVAGLASPPSSAAEAPTTSVPHASLVAARAPVAASLVPDTAKDARRQGSNRLLRSVSAVAAVVALVVLLLFQSDLFKLGTNTASPANKTNEVASLTDPLNQFDEETTLESKPPSEPAEVPKSPVAVASPDAASPPATNLASDLERLLQSNLPTDNLDVRRDENQKDEKSLDQLIASAEQGDTASQKRLGEIYSRGIDVKRDTQESFKWFLRAADAGDADAQFIIGKNFSRGFGGVPRDLKEAVAWLRKSAEGGNGKAQAALAEHYIRGLGVSKDADEAQRWIDRARASGVQPTSTALAELKTLRQMQSTVTPAAEVPEKPNPVPQATPAVVGNPSDQPAIIVSIAKLSDQLEDIKHLITVAGFGDAYELFDAQVQPVLTGLAKDRRAGAVLYFRDNEIVPQWLAFLPVDDADSFLDGLAAFAEVDDSGNELRISFADGPQVFAKSSNRYLFVTGDRATFSQIPDDPETSLHGLSDARNIHLRILVGRIPRDVRESLLEGFRSLAAAGNGNKPSAAEQVEAQVAQFRQLLDETRSMDLGVDISKADSLLTIQLDFDCVPGTELARQCNDARRLPPSRFTGFIDPREIAHLNQRWCFSQNDARYYKQMVSQLRSQFTEFLNSDPQLTAGQRKRFAKPADEIQQWIEAVVDAKIMDVGAIVMGDGGRLDLAAGMQGPNPEKLEDAIKLLAAITTEVKQPDWQTQLNSSSIGNIRLHTLHIPVSNNQPEVAKKLFGDSLKVIVGIGDRSVYVATGHDPRTLLTRCIRRSEKAKTFLDHGHAQLHTIQLMQLLNRAMPDPVATAVLKRLGGDDRISFLSNPVRNGMRSRIEIQLEQLKMIRLFADESQTAKNGGS